CLAVEPNVRLADAGAVAVTVTRYLNGVQERLRTAELAQARAESRAFEEKRRRRTQFFLVAALLVLVAGSGSGGVWYKLDRRARAAELALQKTKADHRVTLKTQEANLLHGEKRTHEALAAARQAAVMAQDDRVSEAQRDVVRTLVATLDFEFAQT